MKIGVMFSGIKSKNGADYVAEFLAHGVRNLGHEPVLLGKHGGPQFEGALPGNLAFIIHSSGYGLKPGLIKRFQEKAKLILWTHNDEMDYWQKRIVKITNLVDIHYSYTKKHPYGDHVRYMPLAAEPWIYHPIPGAEKKYNAVMIGSSRKYRKAFSEALKKIVPSCFFSFTMGLSHKEVNQIYNEARIVVAPIQDCDEDQPGRAWGCPCRTFDVPCSGAFQIQTMRPGLSDVYPMAYALEPIQDPVKAAETWADSIEYFLARPSMKEAFASEVWEHTQRFHLYKHRVQQMIDEV
ncbi:MAG: glycosyltransferase family 1 protein [Proteobacteria bacterium]|nr:glycosyltransferase family 1 protein [Pseudomonadota bacterium]